MTALVLLNGSEAWDAKRQDERRIHLAEIKFRERLRDAADIFTSLRFTVSELCGHRFTKNPERFLYNSCIGYKAVIYITS